MATQAFKKLILSEIKIIGGESPSPSKLNGIFALYNLAFTKLESYLGNGIDYGVMDGTAKKMLANLASVIGSSTKLYKPVNSLDTLLNLYNKYRVSYTQSNDYTTLTADLANIVTAPVSGMTYTSGTNDYITVTSKAYIPVEAKAGQSVSFVYSGSGIVLAGSQQWTLPNQVNRTPHSTVLTAAVELITLTSPNASTPIKIYSMAVTYLPQSATYNYGPCIPLENQSYWFIRVPCRYANPLASGGPCIKRWGDYCIGNEYDYTTGLPTCTATPSYVSEPTSPKQYYRVMQSPLLTLDLPHAIRYRPYAPTSGVLNQQVEDNKLFIYDNTLPDNPIQTAVPIYNTGRPDVFYIQDATPIISLGNNLRYIIVGGDYSINESLQTILREYVPKQMLSGESVYSIT